jgi:DNA invertase Pin-like site-specific DNA recombinase
VIYARVSSKDQEKEGYSIPAQLELLRGYAGAHGFDVLKEFTDVETAKAVGRTSFGEMIMLLQKAKSCRTVLVEKTDRLYRNLKDWVTIEDLGLEIHFVKENVILAPNSRSSEKFMHGIKVLMAKNYIDNLSEETRKGMLEKARQGIWPSFAPLGYINVDLQRADHLRPLRLRRGGRDQEGPLHLLPLHRLQGEMPRAVHARGGAGGEVHRVAEGDCVRRRDAGLGAAGAK